MQILKNQDGEERADRIVDDPLPFQDRARPGSELRLAQQGYDDGGAGDHEDSGKEDGDRQREPGHVMGCHGAQRPADEHTGKHEAPHAAGRVAQFVEVQAQSALKQNDRYGDGNHRPEELAEIGLGLEHPGDRPRQDPGHRHEHNGRQVEAPGKPLGANPEHADQRQFDNDVFHKSERSTRAGSF